MQYTLYNIQYTLYTIQHCSKVYPPPDIDARGRVEWALRVCTAQPPCPVLTHQTNSVQQVVACAQSNHERQVCGKTLPRPKILLLDPCLPSIYLNLSPKSNFVMLRVCLKPPTYNAFWSYCIMFLFSTFLKLLCSFSLVYDVNSLL